MRYGIYNIMRQTVFLVFCILLLSQVVVSQRGGGGSSGGSSGGGGSSYSGGGSYYNNYGYNRGSYYSYTPSCFQRCYGNAACIQNCRNSQVSGSTAGIIVGSICGGLCLCGLCCFCCNKHGGRCCKGNMYQKLKKQYNIVDTSMPAQQFRSKRDRILYLINKSQAENNFALQQASEKYPIKAHAQIVSEQQNISEFNMQGGDKFGTWKAKGFILCKNGQVAIWFYKEYDDKEAAGQTDQWEDLIYESDRYDDRNGVEGRWFYYGQEYSDLYSGKWKLWQPNTFGQNINNPGYNPNYNNSYNPNPVNYGNNNPNPNPYYQS